MANFDSLWSEFLNKIKVEVEPMSFDSWFKDTKLISLKDNVAKVLVPLQVTKKHLQENYDDLIKDIFNDISGSNYTFDYVLQEEIDKNIVIDTNSYGVPNIEDFDSGLDSKYTFDTFVVGETNKFAYVNALAVAEAPGRMYNPLFIYGNSGLGKTHLMHAIGNYIVKNSNKKVLYITSDNFVEDFTKIYRTGKKNNFDVIDSFKDKYRNIDVLMIDDIQYLEIAPSSQQEFFNTFNNLHNKGKQIIISSDRSPDDLKKLENRLRTRFSWGLMVDILVPDFKLKLDIIDKKISANEMTSDFPTEVKEYIASNCNSDIRKLEGAITRVYAYATIMNGSNITFDLAKEALKDYFVKTIISKNKIDRLQQIVASNYNISIEDLKGKKRNTIFNNPRQIAMYIAREYLDESFSKIGNDFGGKDHSTVMHSVDKIKNELIVNTSLANEIQKIVNML